MNTTGVALASEMPATNFQSVILIIEHCVDYNSDALELCASEEDTKTFWTKGVSSLLLNFRFDQVDLQNQTEQIGTISKFYNVPIKTDQFVEWSFELSPNDYFNYDDPIGLFETEVDPYSFLTVQTYRDSSSVATDAQSKYSNTTDWYLPDVQVSLILSDTFLEHERKVYTFFTLIGDVGGFNGAVVLFPVYLMGWYSQRMYSAAIYNEMPLKRKLSRGERKKESMLQRKLKAEKEKMEPLNVDDVNSIWNEVRRIFRQKRPFLKTLMCQLKCLCKKDRE